MAITSTSKRFAGYIHSPGILHTTGLNLFFTFYYLSPVSQIGTLGSKCHSATRKRRETSTIQSLLPFILSSSHCGSEKVKLN